MNEDDDDGVDLPHDNPHQSPAREKSVARKIRARSFWRRRRTFPEPSLRGWWTDDYDDDYRDNDDDWLVGGRMIMMMMMIITIMMMIIMIIIQVGRRMIEEEEEVGSPTTPAGCLAGKTKTKKIM